MSKTENKDILVSIITVTFNSGKTLEKTIKSIINQTYKNIEYIIIDGGSTDETINIIKKHNKYISYWVSEPDEGIYDAMNKGISKANGNIIGIINSDDWYENDAIEQIVSSYTINGDNCIYHGNIKFHYKNGNIEFKRPNLKLDNLYRGTILFHPTFFVPKVIYKKNGLYNTKFIIAADYDFMVRNYKANTSFIYINKCISNMRIEGVSAHNALLGYNETKNIAINAHFKKHKILFFYVIRIIVYKFNKIIHKL